jgi:hypothetical protein
MRNGQKIFTLLIIMVVVRGILYISIFPPWLAPDEATHYEAIRLLGQERVWPTQEVYFNTPMHPQMHASFVQYRIWQLANIPFIDSNDPSSEPYIFYYPARNRGTVIDANKYSVIYHLILSPVAVLSKTLDIDQQLYLLRLTSLLFVTLTVVVGWFFARTVFPASLGYAVAVSSFLVFLPMHMHISTSVNVDVLATLISSIYVFLLARIFCDKISISRVILATILLILAVLIKPTTLFLIPTTVVAFMVYLARRFGWSLRWVAVGVIIMALFTFFMAIIAYQVTNGGHTITSLSLNSSISNMSFYGQSSLSIYLHLIQWGFISFWGLFGWAHIHIPFSWIRLLWIICIACGLGVVAFLGQQLFSFRRKTIVLNQEQKNILLILLAALIFAVIGIFVPYISTQSPDWVPQSRYFFPALLPFALYFFLGFQHLVPAPIQNLTIIVWLTGLIFFDTITVFFVITPYIYG